MGHLFCSRHARFFSWGLWPVGGMDHTAPDRPHCIASHRIALHWIGFSLRAAEKTEESVSLLEKVLGHTDAHAVEVKARAKVCGVQGEE